MKTLRLILHRFCLPALILSLLAPPLSAAPAKMDDLIDFTDVHTETVSFGSRIMKNYEYAFGSWEKHIADIPGKGALVRAPNGKGGLGENKTSVRFGKYQNLEVLFIIGNLNTANSISFSLEDRDGTEQTWHLSLASLGKGKEYSRRIDLTKPSTEVKPGKTPGLNLNKIATWQIKGDYTDPNVEILLLKVAAAR